MTNFRERERIMLKEDLKRIRAATPKKRFFRAFSLNQRHSSGIRLKRKDEIGGRSTRK